jgi:hypothetical protein
MSEYFGIKAGTQLKLGLIAIADAVKICQHQWKDPETVPGKLTEYCQRCKKCNKMEIIK